MRRMTQHLLARLGPALLALSLLAACSSSSGGGGATPNRTTIVVPQGSTVTPAN